MVDGRDANKYLHVYDNFSAHGQLLCFSHLIMIDMHMMVIVGVIPVSYTHLTLPTNREV